MQGITMIARILDVTPSALAIIIAGCGTTASTHPAHPEGETLEQRCARAAATPHVIEPPVKLSGEPAELTPESQQAAVQGAVGLRCSITTRGTAALCEFLDRVPASQEQAILMKLASWRFRPATYDGQTVALETTFSVPLVAPLPGREAPKAPAMDTVPPGAVGDVAAPKLIVDAPPPAYTGKALEQCAEGRAVARCTITEEGAPTDCFMVKSVPAFDEAVLATLAKRRYTPVLFKGKPVRVFYTFPFTFRLK